MNLKYALYKQVDPYLKLGEEIKVQASFTGPGGEVEGYGTQEDEVAALRSLSAIKSEDRQLKEIVISNLTTTYEKLSEVIKIVLLYLLSFLHKVWNCRGEEKRYLSDIKACLEFIYNWALNMVVFSFKT